MSALDKQVGGDHYKRMAIQPVEFITKNGIGFLEGNVIKYVCRWRAKNGLADLEKAKHYIELMIDLEKKAIEAAKAAAPTPSYLADALRVGIASAPSPGYKLDVRAAQGQIVGHDGPGGLVFGRVGERFCQDGGVESFR